MYYLTTDKHLHEMNFNTHVWHDGDLTVAGAASVVAVATSGLSSFIASSGGISVYYVGTDSHVHEMNFNLTSWHDGDVTLAAGNQANAAGVGGVSSFIASTGGIAVFYLASSGDLDQLNFNGSTWGNGDLTSITGANAPIHASALTSFVQ